MNGDFCPSDSIYVNNAVEQLNGLSLPVKLHMANDSSIANLFVYFGDYDYLEQRIKLKNDRTFGGTGAFPDHSLYIDSATVGIANNAPSYLRLNNSDAKRVRQHVVLEEITQILGISGDSWAKPNSIFFEGKNRIQRLSITDKEIIKLLYEPCFPPKYSRKQFEEDFQDVLYHKNATYKIINYVKENNVPLSYLEYIRDNCFYNSLMFKYPGFVYVKIRGNYSQQDYEFCKKAVALINTASGKLQLKIEEDEPWNELPSINILYNDSALINRVISERSLNSPIMMFTRRISGNIKLSYNKSNLKDQESKNKLLFRDIYRILGFDNSNNEIIDIDSLGNISFEQDYKELLSLLYNPVFPNNFTLDEMDEVINSLKQGHDF